MNRKYDEILSVMKNTFFESCGESVEEYSELETRFKAVASELFSLYCNSDFVLRQAFPQTAEGAYLDFHAQLRGITRKSPSKAKLMLTFYLNEPSEEATVIDEGCICADSSNPYIQFVTTESAVILPGVLSETVEAEATEAGSSHNVQAGSVTVIVNPPLSVSGVTNEAPFLAGFDEENDSMLRKRILEAYSIPSTGFSLASIKEAILGIDEILDCSVSYSDGTLKAAVKTKNSIISQSLRQKIENRLLCVSLFGADTEIVIAEAKRISLKLDIKCDSTDFERIENEARQIVKDKTASLRTGETLVLNSLAYSLSCIEGTVYCDITCADATGGLVLCESDEYIIVDTVEVACHE